MKNFSPPYFFKNQSLNQLVELNGYYLSDLIFRVKEFEKLFFLYFALNLFVSDPELWSLVLNIFLHLKIFLHFLKCGIFLSHLAITRSWAKCLIHHLVFLTCLNTFGQRTHCH